MLKKIGILFVLGLLISAALAFYAYQQTNAYLDQPVQIEQETLMTVEPGMHFRSFLNSLEQQELIEENSFSKLASRLAPELTSLKVGTFQVQPSQSLRQVLAYLVEGKEHQFSITFIEGSRFSEWMLQFAESKDVVHTLDGVSEKEIAQRLGIERDKLEGLFLAETYHFTKGTSDLDILKRAHRKLNEVVNEAWDKRQDKLPLKNEYEALILASIIEKETAIDSERERVSSVFINRLNIGMRLQTDPTVIYGMGDSYDGNIRKKDLRTPTPYNTYTMNGLPPTPIAMAGPASIHAAVNPEASKYLYFVASGKGGHVFSKSLTEHNRAVRAYLKQLRINKSQ
ncbi:endolytic transglycosylase MltG [Vibrio maerlii]|uniref:endolytic transglycosylase MltG n=1 Tax=Vibrio maerlii TaxID=2231648 RepID=UPI000E3E86FA|nr:endolytic transglycosylase MltG [Vibrio maerlii]